jgi:hypothetical protein
MNGAVGTTCNAYESGAGHSGKPTLSVNGPWLNGANSNRRNARWRTYGNLSETVIPGSARLWVILEEDASSLNDANFGFSRAQAEWSDFPSTRHAMSCAIAFGDGRVELHKWQDQRTKVAGNPMRRPVPGSADWQWLAE